MIGHLDRALSIALAHESRRRAQLPPLNDLPLRDDEALRIVRQEEMRRQMMKLGRTIDKATSP